MLLVSMALLAEREEQAVAAPRQASPGHTPLDRVRPDPDVIAASARLLAEVDDLVGVYHFPASKQSACVTGHTMVVDGSRLAGYRKSVLAMLAPQESP